MRYLLYISVLILAVIGTAAQGQDAAFVTALQQIPECPVCSPRAHRKHEIDCILVILHFEGFGQLDVSHH